MMLKSRKIKVCYITTAVLQLISNQNIICICCMKLHISEQQFSANNSSNSFDKRQCYAVADKNKTHNICFKKVTEKLQIGQPLPAVATAHSYSSPSSKERLPPIQTCNRVNRVRAHKSTWGKINQGNWPVKVDWYYTAHLTAEYA